MTMRSIYALGIGSLTSSMLADAATIKAMESMRITQVADFRKPKTYRTGKKYPFSSKRQNDRFARQLAAGKVKFAA